MMRCAAVCALALSAATQGHAQILSVTPPSIPRDFGYFTGDVLTGTASITVAPGTVLDRATLPVVGPVAPSIDIRGVSVEQQAQRYTVRVTYQSFEAPDRVARFDVPPYSVWFAAAGKRYAAAVPGFSFTASAFRNDLAPLLNASVLRPDPAWAVPDADGAWRMLAAGAVLVVIAAGILWRDTGHIAWRARKPPPFAAAARQIAALNRKPAEGAATQALLYLHRAFDETAGSRLFADDLDRFLTRDARFMALRGEVTDFFAASRGIFFGGRTGPTLSLGRLANLAHALMLAERGR